MVSEVKSHKGRLRQIRQIQYRQSHFSTGKDKEMTSKQTGQNEFIVQAVAEATRVAIQTMASTGMARQENAGIKISNLILKQPTFNWRAKDKYFELVVSNML